MRLNMTTINKSAAAREATAQGEKFFTATCDRHGETEHYSSNRKCVQCVAEETARKTATRRSDPEARAEYNAYNRDYETARKAQDPTFVADRRAHAVNSNTFRRLREDGRPETAMPTPETLLECAAVVRHAPAGSEMDHGVPLIGTHPVTKKESVCGLHVPYNLEPMTKRSNVLKLHWFDPENPLEFQKPYNSFPGGQFHGDIGEIEFMRYTQPTTLELTTAKEWRQAIIDGGNEDMTEWAAQCDHWIRSA